MGPFQEAMQDLADAMKEGRWPSRRMDHAETLRTILSMLNSNASRDNIRRVIENAIEGGK